jgi:hypothetical protein
MNRRTSTSTRAIVSSCATLFLGAAVLLLSSPAFAGFGNPLKKVKEKVTKTADSKAAEESQEPGQITEDTVVFDDLVLELTDARLGNIAATFQSAKAAGAGRPALVEKLNKAQNDQRVFGDKNADAIRQTQQKRDELDLCYHDGYHEAQDRKSQEYAQKALTGDPAMLQKFARAAQENNEAAAKGDSAAIQRAQAALQSEAWLTHEDSLAVQKTCGAMPPPHPAGAKLAAMDKEIAALYDQIRAVDDKVAEAQAEQGKMTREQFGTATERIQMYLAWKSASAKSKTPPVLRGYTPEEIDAMEKRIEELRAALG